MREDLLRHALTASLAALLASLVTTQLLTRSSGAAEPGTSATAVSARTAEDPDTLAEIRDAVRAVEHAVHDLALRQQANPPGRVEAAPAKLTSPLAGNGATTALSASPSSAVRRSSAAPLAPVQRGRIEDLHQRQKAWDNSEDDDYNNDPRRELYMLTVEALIAEFGTPTNAGWRDNGALVANWSSGESSVSAYFIDGRCVWVETRMD